MIPDLASANGGSDDVYVHLGLGNSEFEDPKIFSVGKRPISLAAGFYDDDAVLDLAVANGIVNFDTSRTDFSIYLGVGDGTFLLFKDFKLIEGPTFIFSEDLNLDGIHDIVVGNFSITHTDSLLSIYLGTGDGSFVEDTIIAVGKWPSSAAAGDFNSDGNIDLAVGNAIGTGVSILMGGGDGGFVKTSVYDVSVSGAHSIAIGDINMDGVEDIVTEGQDAIITVFLGVGDGTFGSEIRYVAGKGGGAINLGDLDNDGDIDMVTPAVSVFINKKITTSVTDYKDKSISISTSLGQNYPNPFNSATTISYELPKAGFVILKIYNILGETVKVLVDSAQPAVEHKIRWNGLNAQGMSVATGIYLYELTIRNQSLNNTTVKKMMLLK